MTKWLKVLANDLLSDTYLMVTVATVVVCISLAWFVLPGRYEFGYMAGIWSVVMALWAREKAKGFAKYRYIMWLWLFFALVYWVGATWLYIQHDSRLYLWLISL